MSRELIDAIYLVEQHRLAIPEIKKMLEEDRCEYIAGSLILNIADPAMNAWYMTMEVRPLSDYASDIIREAQYLTSKMYLKHKGPKYSFYKQAKYNVEEYEKEFAAE